MYCPLLELSLRLAISSTLVPKENRKVPWYVDHIFEGQKSKSLTGLLNLTCSAVIPGRAFLRQLFDLPVSVSKPHHLTRLNKDVKADLEIFT